MTYEEIVQFHGRGIPGGLRKNRRAFTKMGETIEFSNIDESLFWGYEPLEGYFLASAEKAYLDTLHYHRDPEKWGEQEKDMLDLKVLQSLATKFPKRTVKRIRIGN